ncbi:metal ABC transporter ATP-binding protein [Nitrosophilus kaiyonis]|uniref:metal ABC transporter ATP-binding protein n=1 Tax=Nitrosophilus kaiyonis TaxID=2930200 RepID=UPI00249012F5|nr:metal ABC transporter ATP-binding protein [Nitrosophilus kaiyonis]
MKEQIAIEVKNLYFKYYKDYVLEDINLKIKKNEYIAIIGPNGGGKSTFLKLIVGLLKPNKGEIKIFGKNVQDMKEYIGYLPQQINFNLDLPIKVKDIVLQGRLKKNKLFYNKEDFKKCDEILKKLNIENLENKKISELSGGQRQKVLLSRALVSEPKILILDEPTASIDIKGQKEIYEILKNLKLTKIVVSHDIKILFEGVDKVFYINRNLFVHENPKLSIHPKEEHFCEMELFDYLKSCNV